ncbi:hypothetical protein [Desulfurobacterium crinifex]
MIKLKPKMLRGVSFSIESNGKEVSVDSLFPRGFKTKLIERFLEEFSTQVKTDDPEKFVKALFYFVYGDNVPKHAREKESDIIEFLKWRVGAPVKGIQEEETSVLKTVPKQDIQIPESSQAVEEHEARKEPEPVKDEVKEAPKPVKKRISFTDVLPYAYKGDDE